MFLSLCYASEENEWVLRLGMHKVSAQGPAGPVTTLIE